MADATEHRVLFVAQGRGADTLDAFIEDFKQPGGVPGAIEWVSIDLSPSVIKEMQANLPNATVTFDKFHVVAHASKAVD